MNQTPIKVTITIEGGQNTGKTVLANHIRRQLWLIGYENVKLNDDEFWTNGLPVNKKPYSNAEITIKTIQKEQTL